jgi:DNA-binding response OmpR family regulator
MTNRILIVDDDREFAKSVALRCRSLGFEVETANTPLDAVMSMSAHTPDLLCLDVNMPTGNGLDLCEYLIREGQALRTPVIILSGQTDRETIYRSLQLRTRFVRKSTDLWPDLKAAISELLPSCHGNECALAAAPAASKPISQEPIYD